MELEKFSGKRLRKRPSDEIEIVAFYKSLNVELDNFALTLEELMRSRLLIKEKRDGRIVGIAGIRDNNLLFLIVKNEFQNQKIGQKLMTKVITLAKQRKYHYVALNVFASNVKALHIYKKFGFKIVTSNILNFRKNYFMILPLDLRGRIYEALMRMHFKYGPYFIARLSIVRKLWPSFRSLFY